MGDNDVTTTSEGNRCAFAKYQGFSLPNTPHETNREVALKNGGGRLQLVREVRVWTTCGRKCMAEKGSERTVSAVKRILHSNACAKEHN
jgi:hypothetical protein